MNKVGKSKSEIAYIDLANDKQYKSIKENIIVKKQSSAPKSDSKIAGNIPLSSRKTDVQCYKDICDQMKTVGSRVTQRCIDKITSSETAKSKASIKSKGLLGGLAQAVKGVVVNSVITTNLKDFPKALREHPEQTLILGSQFAASDKFIKTLNDVYSKDTKVGRLLNAAGIPGEIKTVIDAAQKSKETIKYENAKEISKNVLNAARQILPIMQKSSPIIKKLQMEKTLEIIQKHLPSEKECPSVIEKLASELLKVADLYLKNPKSIPDGELLKQLLNKAVEILQEKK